ncbi:hypothetical protein SIN8267_01760 [Sinobacterium norvegicum]|uniref:SRPBCC domain-containing protein n=1 Tax=Sinobacterium norvegicum TaxID=1641715 RepID=A0ABN8EKG3_9GAMM|nr:SRPBCC domain-containing protein [Sinobacterium norvegicum]CAH0991650.1 hypothetical protein SIN8267_01760 [Sinobacterium norvegicum]
MAVVINHQIDIDTTTETVWQVITDTKKYGEWNPFVVACHSTLAVGSPINMKVRVMPFFAQPQKETILEHLPGEALSYGIKMPLGMLSSHRRHWVTETEPGKACYVSTFKLEGWLSPLVKLFVGGQLQRGFNEMSAAIGQRALQLK